MPPPGHTFSLARCITPVLLAFMVFLLSRCAFQLKDEYVNPVVPPKPIDVVVEVVDPNFTDPYLLDLVTLFRIRFQVAYPVLEYQVTVDTRPINSVYANQILQFELNPLAFAPGTHTVDIQMKFRTLSGSLADQLQAEYFLIERSFQIVIDPTIPVPVAALSAKMENGYMVLRWNMGNNRPYRYRLSRINKQGGYFADALGSDFVASNKTMLVDSGYVGGYMSYNLQIYNAYTSANVGYVKVNQSPATFSITRDENQFATLRWTNPKVAVSLTLSGTRGSKTVSTAVGSIALDSLFLGDEKKFRVLVHRNNYPFHTYDTSITVTQAPPNLPPFTAAVVLPVQSKLILLQRTGLQRYSFPNLVKEDAVVNDFVWVPESMGASADGNHLVVSNTAMNALDFAQRKGVIPYLTDPDGSSDNVTVLATSSVSNTGLQGINYLHNGIRHAGIRDITKDNQFDQMLWSEAFNSDVPVISEDGQYMTLNSSDKLKGNVYKNTNGTWTLTGTVPTGKKYFRGHATSELIVAGANIQVFVVSAPASGNGNYQAIRTFTLPTANLVTAGYDLSSQHIYVQTINAEYYSTIKTYSISDFTLVGKAKAYVPPAAPFPTQHIYSNHFHFLSTGYGAPFQP